MLGAFVGLATVPVAAKATFETAEPAMNNVSFNVTKLGAAPGTFVMDSMPAWAKLKANDQPAIEPMPDAGYCYACKGPCRFSGRSMYRSYQEYVKAYPIKLG